MSRLFDIFFSLIGLLILSPVLFILFLACSVDTQSPFFRQERVGQSKQTFMLIKFRTMRRGTLSVGTHLVDPDAITSLGKLLRRSKLDELPQLWNVLKGEMSLVGPRPNLPGQKAVFEARDRLGVYNVRPGMTGLSQINGVDMSTPALLAKTDNEMIRNMSTVCYLKYVLLTVIGKGQGDKANK